MRINDGSILLIMKAERKDLTKILDLQYLAYQSEAQLLNNPAIPPLTQTIQEVEKEFENGIILKAVNEEDVIVGSVRAYSDNNTLYIGKLIVRLDLQRQGIGKRLLAEIEQHCRYPRYELFTSSKSENNINLYERAGYKRFKEKEVSKCLKFIYLEKLSVEK
ncbi:GNAT family N-acetyltransferase [Lachnospiraceae bacterium ZAX-1]